MMLGGSCGLIAWLSALLVVRATGRAFYPQVDKTPSTVDNDAGKVYNNQALS